MSFEKDPFANDARRNRRQARLGDDPTCVMCGYSKPEALVAGPSGLLEKHHALGAANDPGLTMWVCRNCHAELTEGQRDAGVALDRGERHPLERIEAFLRAIADLLMRIADAAWKLAERLTGFMTQLDDTIPGWREA